MPDTWQTHCLATVKNERVLELLPWQVCPQCCQLGLSVVMEPAGTAETREDSSLHQVPVACLPSELVQSADEAGGLLQRSRPVLTGPAAVRLAEAARLVPARQTCWAQESMAQPCAVAAREMHLQPNPNLLSHLHASEPARDVCRLRPNPWSNLDLSADPLLVTGGCISEKTLQGCRAQQALLWHMELRFEKAPTPNLVPILRLLETG